MEPIIKKDNSIRISMESQKSILQNIKNGVYGLTKKEKSKSKVWIVFSQITKKDGSILDGYVYCCKCGDLHTFDGKIKKELLNHKCVEEEPISNDDVKKENDLDEDVKERDESLPNLISDLHIDKASSLEGALNRAKQLNYLCEIMKDQLQDASFDIFNEAISEIFKVLSKVCQEKITSK